MNASLIPKADVSARAKSLKPCQDRLDTVLLPAPPPENHGIRQNGLNMMPRAVGNQGRDHIRQLGRALQAEDHQRWSWPDSNRTAPLISDSQCEPMTPVQPGQAA